MSWLSSSRCVANGCRKVWHVAGLAMPALRTASLTARWRTDSCRVMATPLTGAAVHVEACRREDPLPSPGSAGVRILAQERVGQRAPASTMPGPDGLADAVEEAGLRRLRRAGLPAGPRGAAITA